MKAITIEQAQQSRLNGKFIVVNRNFTKVISVTDYKPKLVKANNRLFLPLVTVKLSKQYQDAAWDKHKLINKLS
jgi:hypothetical protein